MKDKQGIVLVYTGKGKGKTTASLGLALRAAGHNERIFMVQFRKGDPNYGEIKAIQKYLPDFTIVQTGKHKMSEDGELIEDGTVLKEALRQGKKQCLAVNMI